MVGAGAPRGAGAPICAAEPSPGQVCPVVASCGRLWPSCGRLWLAAASCGAAGPSCGAAGPGQVRPALHHYFGAAL
jgi:hypothetical protein